jgi:deoxyribodipyrimidine photolyase-related protein
MARASTRGSTKGSCRNLVFIAGDQLSPNLAGLRAADRARDVILMAEAAEETGYVPHHVKKIAFVLSAMRHFAQELRQDGWRVVYRRLDDPDNAGSLTGEIEASVARLRPERVMVTEPGEWRVLDAMMELRERLCAPMHILPDDRFICPAEEFAEWARGRKQLRMEFFYREMRRKTGLLMEGDKPDGGAWNFDKENRKPPRAGLALPGPLRVEPDAITREVIELVRQRFASNFGDLEPFWFPVTRRDAQAAFARFLAHGLPRFGDYQDAMASGEPFIFHSLASIHLNCGLLDPIETCRLAEAEWRAGRAPLNAVEGFIRQIIGWREFVRGLYWLEGPGYTASNWLGQDAPLPAFYWTGETRMACMREALAQTKAEAYAHHIQRLMVTGNFALVAGVSPQALHEWYLSVYADAYEWVEAPNTLGMSQFADGGRLASKPYAASGAYIDRMSDYCNGCAYDPRKRTSDDACPFNALYWDFLARHRAKLAGNPRMAHAWRGYDNFPDQERAAITRRAAALRADLDAL